MLVLFVCLLVPLVSGEFCRDLCLARGHADCLLPGIACIEGRVCARLFWEGPVGSALWVDTAGAGGGERVAVSCAEATLGVVQRATISDLIFGFADSEDESYEHCQSFCRSKFSEPECVDVVCNASQFCQKMFWTTQARKLCVETGGGDCSSGSPVPCSFAALELMLAASDDSDDSDDPEAIAPEVLQFEGSTVHLQGPRPAVKVFFSGNGNGPNPLIPLILDTAFGSVLVAEAAYSDNGMTKESFSRLPSIPLPISATFLEDIVIPGYPAVTLDSVPIFLIDPSDQPSLGSGVLGASRESELAAKTVFTIVPAKPRENLHFIENFGFSARLFLGDPHTVWLNCGVPEPDWIREFVVRDWLEYRVSIFLVGPGPQWVVPGVISSPTVRRRPFYLRTQLSIETAKLDLYVPEGYIEHIRLAATSKGGFFDDILMEIRNCAFPAMVPSVSFDFGHGAQVQLTFNDFVQFDQERSICRLIGVRKALSTGPLPVGWAVLRKLVLQFDQAEGQVRMCLV